MMAWKYIMIEVKVSQRMNVEDGITVQFPIIFSDKMVHADIAAAMKGVLTGYGFDKIGVASAGNINQVIVHGLGGESETLGIESIPEDKDTIEAYSYGHGIKQR